jgi:hypothetical protein
MDARVSQKTANLNEDDMKECEKSPNLKDFQIEAVGQVIRVQVEDTPVHPSEGHPHHRRQQAKRCWTKSV